MQTEKVVIHIVDWLKNYADNAKVKGFVVGISGGIDSATVACLCAKTGYPTLCIELPIHQDSKQTNRAKELIVFLQSQYKNVSTSEINLTAVFDSFVKVAPISKNKDLENLSLANTRARLRMTSLYYLAGINQYLVTGTGNKVEDFGVGFYTKYGDGGVDISPIADLMKSEVYKLAIFMGVPQSIINAPPTDGLFGDGRTDEDQLGASYDELEWAMKMVEINENPENFSEREKIVFAIYKRLNTANQHKINPIPICTIPIKWK